MVPNIVATLTPAQEEGLARWFSRDTMSPENRKQAEKFRDPQLIRAVDAMKGALVYSRIQGGNAKEEAEDRGENKDPSRVEKPKTADGQSKDKGSASKDKE